MSEDYASLLKSVLMAALGGSSETARELAKAHFPFERRVVSSRTRIGYAQQAKLFERDGYRCRYFGDKLLFPGVLLLTEYLMGEEFPADPGYRVAQSHWIYWYLWPVLDHKNSVASGECDPNREENLLTTSTFRNVQKGSWSLAQLGWTDRGVSQRSDNWDGMVGWFREYMKSAPPAVWEHRNTKSWSRAIGVPCPATNAVAKEEIS